MLASRKCGAALRRRAHQATAALKPHLGATNMQPTGLVTHDTGIQYLARTHGTDATIKPRKRVIVRKPARGPSNPHASLPSLVAPPPPAIDVSKLGMGNASEAFDQMPTSVNLFHEHDERLCVHRRPLLLDAKF